MQSTSPMSMAEINAAFQAGFGRPAQQADYDDIMTDAAVKGWDGVREWFLVRPQQLGLPGLPPSYFDHKNWIELALIAAAIYFLFIRKS